MKSCSLSSSSDDSWSWTDQILGPGLLAAVNEDSLLALEIGLGSSSTGSSGNVPVEACRERVIRVGGGTPVDFFSPLGGIYLKILLRLSFLSDC